MRESWPTVLITDETLRDGLQIERPGVSVDEKLELLDMLVDAGLRRLVVGAFVNPAWSPQMAGTLELVQRLEPVDGVEFFALALNDRGREERRGHAPPLCIDPMPVTHLHLCPIFLQRNTNRAWEDQERAWRLPVDRAREAGAAQASMGLSAAWGSNWSGPFTVEQRMAALRRQHEAWADAGIEVVRVDLADPMGWNTPMAVEEDILEIKRRFPSVRQFHLHLHNTRGLAMLSAHAALRVLSPEDTLIVDAAVGGIGGCPYCGNGQGTGMIPTEDFVQLLASLGIGTGIRLDKLIDASARLAGILGRRLHSQVALNGPLPARDERYSPDLPVVYTFEEAQHFRLGPSTCTGNARPWLRQAAMNK